MILTCDIGNTNIVFGLFKGNELTYAWRISSERRRTPCEISVLVKSLFEMEGLNAEEIEGIAISSVVPPLTNILKEALLKITKEADIVIVGPGVKTGISVLVENPKEVGTDRIVNAVAGYHLYGGPLIIVDFGTATTFDVVSEKGEYLGGAISPGIGISMEALFRETAQLPRIDLQKPQRVIGKNTVESMQSGVFYGYVGLVDGMIERIMGEIGRAKIIATGGYATLLATSSKYIEKVEPNLTLLGLKIIYDKNKRKGA
ncbi:MAG: type III pantothenate kinase [Thermosulfidibacteraceae bacterium]